MKYIKYIREFIAYLGLASNDKKSISLTNILMVVVIVKIAMTPTLTMTDIAVLLGALTNYIHKRKGASENLHLKEEENKEDV